MKMKSTIGYSQAIQEFNRIRFQAAMQSLLARLGGTPQKLLSLVEVRRRLGSQAQRSLGLREIPLNKIVGSLGRQTDFNRQFLPRKDSQAGRWARVRMAYDHIGLPPIEVYKLGEIYFVADGHHRVSVARQLGATHIEAYVTEIELKAPHSAEPETNGRDEHSESQGLLGQVQDEIPDACECPC
jgi:hypothetical protein